MANNIRGQGRKLDFSWADVNKIETEGKLKAECKHCKILISSKIERIKAHLQKCAVLTKKRVADEDINKMSEIESSRSSSVFEESASTSMSERKRRRQTGIESFIVQTSVSEKQKLDIQIAKFFYGCNVAFNIADNKLFKDMICALRPGYDPPSRKKLSGELLDIVYKEIEKNVISELSAEDVSFTMMQDGWSSIKNDPIVATSIHTGEHSILIDAVEPSDEKKTALYCSEIAKKNIEYIKETYNKDVFAICTDNEAKMVNMKDILKKTYPNLLTYGCSSHLMNLLEKEVTPKTITKHVIEVHKYFRNKHLPHGWLKEKKGLMSQLPNETRWKSHEACLATFIGNYHIYVEIRTEKEQEFDKNISKILDNVAIYREALHLQKQLAVIVKALDRFQSDSVNISDAVEIWKDVLDHDLLQPYKREIVKRYDFAIQPFHLFANTMDPKYMGRRLTGEEEETVEQWVASNLSDEFLAVMLLFKIKDTDMFPATLFKEELINKFSTKKWWKLMSLKNKKTNKIADEFCTHMLSLFSCPASSASIERIFSSYGLIWTKLRNRLGADRAANLVKIYRHLRTKSNEESDENIDSDDF